MSAAFFRLSAALSTRPQPAGRLLRSCLSTQACFGPRSFFGVEDFLDDDNSRPYTYQKEKKSKNPNKHISFKQRTIAYVEPFTLDVFFSKRFVSASVTHRVTSKQVAVAGTNSKDIKAALKSRSDIPACLAIGRILSDRAREADVFTASYTPRERDKFEGSKFEVYVMNPEGPIADHNPTNMDRK
ncbi:putative ribosomal protein L18 [Helianthus debilis subsp. tardiflorus]